MLKNVKMINVCKKWKISYWSYVSIATTNTHKLNFLLVCPETEWRRKETKNKKDYCKKKLFYMQTKQLLLNLQSYNENF